MSVPTGAAVITVFGATVSAFVAPGVGIPGWQAREAVGLFEVVPQAARSVQARVWTLLVHACHASQRQSSTQPGRLKGAVFLEAMFESAEMFPDSSAVLSPK